MKYPKLPATIDAPAGPITVRLASEITAKDSGVKCWGLYEEDHRRITIDVSPPLAFQWRVLYHEWMHAVLSDSGLAYLLTDAVIEAICDATATARWRERFG